MIQTIELTTVCETFKYKFDSVYKKIINYRISNYNILRNFLSKIDMKKLIELTI